jgi:serine acetyltransferase
LKIGNEDIDCLVDTGANMNIFTMGSEIFKEHFPSAERIYRYNVYISGFGKGEEKAELYQVKHLKLTSDYGEDYIAFENFMVACFLKPEIGATMVLAYGMFENMRLMFNHNMGVNGTVVIGHDVNIYNGDKIIGRDGNGEVKERIVRMSAFSQEE